MIWFAGRNFARHNKKVWDLPIKKMGGPEILVEFSLSDPLIGFSYLANVLATEFQSDIRAFVSSPKARGFVGKSLVTSLLQVGFFLSSIPRAKIYKSFGARRSILTPRNSAGMALEAKNFSKNFFSQCPTKRDLETLAIENILIGDLIYDTFLRQRRIPTVDISSSEFQKFFRKSIADFLFWLAYFSEKRVASVITSHSAYNLAFPLRIAMERKIPCFVASATQMYRLSSERPHEGKEYLDYPEIYSSLGRSEKSKWLASADEVLRNRFEGSVGPDSDISGASAESYRRKGSEQVLSGTSKTKVLIALHSLSDSPHSGSDALFPDFWEWAKYLAEWSKKSPYEWYLKSHPTALVLDKPFVESLAEEYPHLIVLPDDVSHHQIIEDGVSVVLTVHGTIGFEYALRGVPVVNASRMNPHVRYPFNQHPQSIVELEALLENLHTLPKPSEHDRELARQYFAVKNHLSKKKLLVEHLDGVLPTLKPGEGRHYYSALRHEFVRSFQQARHIHHVQKIRAFVKSERYFVR